MGITDRTFGKQQSTGDRIKQAFIWFCVIPQAIAGWLAMARYLDLYVNGGPVKFMDSVDRFWLQTGIWVMLIVLIVQVLYVWSLRAAYHRVEHVKETIIRHEEGERDEQEIELEQWVTSDRGNVSETAIIREHVNAQNLMHRIYSYPPQTSKECAKLLKAIKKAKVDVEKEPWKAIHGGLLNKRKALQRKENRETKERISGPSPAPFIH